jgi:hypothetical protein
LRPNAKVLPRGQIPMDGYQFTASIFQSLVSLAWPAAALAAVFLFRGKLTELLPHLKLKHKETEVSFKLDKAEKEAAQIPKPPPSPDLQPTPEEKTRFEQLAEHSPRAAILEKRVELEQSLRALAEPYATASSLTGAGSKPLRNNLLTSTRILRKQGIIDSNTSALLDDLRTIGNRAAHSNEADFSVADALRFGKLADETISLIRVLQ